MTPPNFEIRKWEEVGESFSRKKCKENFFLAETAPGMTQHTLTAESPDASRGCSTTSRFSFSTYDTTGGSNTAHRRALRSASCAHREHESEGLHTLTVWKKKFCHGTPEEAFLDGQDLDAPGQTPGHKAPQVWALVQVDSIQIIQAAPKGFQNACGRKSTFVRQIGSQYRSL